MIAFIVSFVFVTSSNTEESKEPQEPISCTKCLKDFGQKFSKSWLHFVLIMYKSSRARITILIEILIHFGLFAIATVFSKPIGIYGQLVLLEISSIFLFTFIEVFFLQQAYYYYDLLLVLIFYTVDAIFFFNAIPSKTLNLIIYGCFHAVAIAFSFSKIFRDRVLKSKPFPFLSRKIINIGLYRGKICILVETVEPREVQLVELDSLRIVNYTPINAKSSLKSYLPQTQLIIIQENHKLNIYCLRTFKMIKQFDMDNINIKTAESVRVEKLEKEQSVRRQSLALACKQYEIYNEIQQLNADYDKINSPKMDSIARVNNTTNDDETAMNKKTDIENSRLYKSQKIYIVHDTKPLIAEIQMIGDETNIRIINFLTNFEERKLVLTMPITDTEQLIQFVRIDGCDKIFFKSPQNSFCLVDINRNLSDIIKQFASKEYQCTIINERDMALAETDNIYIYDIPANLFVKKITKFHQGSHVFPVQNAPGFYLVLPSEDHSHRLHPDIAQLINDQLFSFRIISNKIPSSMKVKSVVYDSEQIKLYIFTDQQIIVENKVILKQAQQPIVSDHIILDVSIYQQANQDY